MLPGMLGAGSTSAFTEAPPSQSGCLVCPGGSTAYWHRLIRLCLTAGLLKLQQHTFPIWLYGTPGAHSLMASFRACWVVSHSLRASVEGAPSYKSTRAQPAQQPQVRQPQVRQDLAELPRGSHSSSCTRTLRKPLSFSRYTRSGRYRETGTCSKPRRYQQTTFEPALCLTEPVRLNLSDF